MKIQEFKSSFVIMCLILSISLSSCGPFKYKRADVKDSPINEAEKRKRNVEEGRGFNIPIGKSSGGNFSFANANELWRAALEVLEFTPLSNVDYGGGIIITDWYSTESNLDQSIKISVQFLTDEIRADGIQVKTFKQSRTRNSWQNVKVNEENNIKIERAIIKKAALLSNQS